MARLKYPSDSSEMKQKYMRDYKRKNPWFKRFVSTKKNAKRRGIEHNMLTADFKEFWFRDKAYLMKRPSIDRIDPTKGYVRSNCRYLECGENSRIGNLGRIKTARRKLTVEQVKEIKLLAREGAIAHRLAIFYNVNSNIIRSILLGTTYQDVKI